MTTQYELEIERLTSENRRLRKALLNLGVVNVLEDPNVEVGSAVATSRPADSPGPSPAAAAPAGGPPP